MVISRILCVAEKPSVAKSISYILHKSPIIENTASVYNKVYKFPYTYQDQPMEMLFTSVTGHLKGLRYLDKYKAWQSWDPAVILSKAEVEEYVPEEKQNLYQNLKNLSPKCEILILWLDCDREGENIAFEVLEVCRLYNPQIKVLRAQFSALTKQDITQALQQLRLPDQNLSDAVNARQEIDLRIGASFTRFQTLLLRRSFQLQGVVSYGPCQFPTLGFVVERHRNIEDFVSECFWDITLKYQWQDSVGENRVCQFNWERGRLFSEYEALVFYDICLADSIDAQVKRVETKYTQKYKPLPLSTVEFEKIITKKLHISAHQAMEIAEKLYNQGYISYPRTETNSFPNSMNLKDFIDKQRPNQTWGKYASDLLDYGLYDKPREGTKNDKAHPPIHPVKSMSQGEANSELEFKVQIQYYIYNIIITKSYELITRHFLACCSRNAQGQETQIAINLNEEQFNAKGLIIQHRNYLDVYPYDRWSENLVPELHEGQSFTPSDVVLEKGQTTPPKPMTESELIGLMDSQGIGTDATIHEHIKTIQDREYAVKTGQAFKPTKLGIALVESYRSMGLTLHLPHLRAMMEQRMAQVAEGHKRKDEIVQETIGEMEIILKEMQQNKQTFINSVGGYLQQLQNYTVDSTGTELPVRQQQMGLCGVCQNNMVFKEMPDGEKKIVCETCSRAYKLPYDGDVKYRPEVCPLCNFQVYKIKFKYTNEIVDIIKRDGKSYVLCPHCYSNPPDDNYVERMPCFTCKISGCQFSSANKNTISPYKCISCSSPMVIRTTKKASLFIGCSKFPQCRQSYFVPQFIKSAKVTDDKCQNCHSKGISSSLVNLEFNDDELMFGSLLRKAQDPMTKWCLYTQCDPEIGSLIKNSQQQQQNTQSSQQQHHISQPMQYNQYQLQKQQKYQQILQTTQKGQHQSGQHQSHTQDDYIINLNPKNNYIEFEFENEHKNNNNSTNNQYSRDTYNQNSNNQNNNHINTHNINNNTQNPSVVTCFKCGEKGHWANQCPLRNNKNGQVEQQNNKEKYPKKGHGQYKKEKNYQKKKVCNFCGIEGKHAKNSDCDGIKKKEKKKEDKD